MLSMDLREKRLIKAERFNKDFLLIFESDKIIKVLVINEKQIRNIINELIGFGFKIE